MSGLPQVGIDGRGRLAATNVYPWHEAIKDLAGARWNARHGAWVLPGTAGSAAALLTILADVGASVSPRVLALAQEGQTREARRQLAADESAPLPDIEWSRYLKTTPWPHQARGAVFLRDSSAALLAVTMGGGKSLTVVAALNMRDVKRALIIAPASVVPVWPRELRLHSAREWHVENGLRRTRTGSLKRLSLADRWAAAEVIFRCGCGRPHAMVTNYEAMTREPLANADLAALGVEVCVWDEAHRLKGAGTGSSWTAKSWTSSVPWRIALTGTPIPQTPDDAYGLFRALDPSIFGSNKTLFRARYIVMGETKDGRLFPKDVIRGQRAEFSRRFHSITFLPRIDLRLPEVSHVVRGVELEPSARRVYEQIRDDGLAEITEAIVAAGGNPTPSGDERTVAPANAGVALLRLAQVTGGATRDDEGNAAIVSRAKAAALSEVLIEVGCVPGGRDGQSRPEPVCVYCRFRTDLEAIEGSTRAAGLRYAEISGARKDGLTDEAKMNPDADVVGVQVASGGVGIDLTRSRIACWWSVGFEAWLFLQAQARQHRPGQTRNVLNIYLCANATIDTDIYAALARKQSIIDAVVNANLRGEAELDVADLPVMDTPGGEVAGEPVGLPSWLVGDAVEPPREVANRELDGQAAALSSSGLAGF